MQLTASSYSSPSCHLQGKRDTEQSKAASISHHFFREFLNSGGRSMDEEGTSSWLRRTNYSNTIYHRLDSSRLASVPLTLQPEVSSRLRRSLEAPSTSKRPVFSTTYIQYNPLTNKQRSVSPLPQTLVSETFKEALSASKRFSTPQTRRGESDKGIGGRKESRECHKSGAKLNRNPSSLKQFASLKIDRKSKKDSAWAKCFDHGGGRVTALEAADQYTVDLSKLFLGHKFAHGAHSRLHHGIYKDEPVAVKIITVPDDESNTPLGLQLEKEYNTEVSILSRLYHPHVIKFVAACRKPPVYFIVTEYLTEGSLRVYLHKLEHRTLPLKKLITCALEIARGMQYVHSQGVIHRDLKPENVLIDNEFHMKIADFGIACEEAYVDLLADDPGTYRWMAPEMIKRKLYGRKVDVYGFGLMLWEMVSGSIPYEDMNPIQAAYAVVNKNLRPPFPKDCPAAMRALIDQCWSSNPDRRPEFYQVVEVLELFESTIAKDGTLDSIQNMGFQDHKKGLLHWVQKLSSSNTSSMPKPKFS